MAELEQLERINSARVLLKSGLEKSKGIASDLDRTSSRLREMSLRLPSLENEVKPIISDKSEQIDCLVGPIAAVLRVYGTVRELEEILSRTDPQDDLFGFLSVLKRLEEGLRFLSSNCELAGRWLEDILSVGGYLSPKLSLEALVKLRDSERLARLKGGIVFNALGKIEDEFSRLLSENAQVIPVKEEEKEGIFIPEFAVLKLQTMISRLEANHRLEKCVSAFMKLRVVVAKKSLEPLNLKYLDEEVTTTNVDNCIKKWGEHLEVAVKRVFNHEYEICNRVFEKNKMTCFASIAIESGILSFLHFGKKILTSTKKDPSKLLKILNLFRVLDKLRPDFSLIFGSQACSEIQAPTRDLVERIVCEASEIFLELPSQVALQRRFSSPPDGSVPGLVTFVTSFCNELLGDNCIHALTEILTIRRKWNKEANNDHHQESFVPNMFRSIMKEIGLNLDEWSKAYADVSLSYLFMMNNHCHFCNLKGTRLGDVMGQSWLSSHARYKDYYAGLYLKQSWGNILPFLMQKTSHDFEKFNVAFEEKFERHSKWVISDDRLRQSVRNLLVETVVPAYRSYIVRYGSENSSKLSAHSLETKLGSLFQPSLVVKYCASNKHAARLIDRIKVVVVNKFCLTQ